MKHITIDKIENENNLKNLIEWREILLYQRRRRLEKVEEEKKDFILVSKSDFVTSHQPESKIETYQKDVLLAVKIPDNLLAVKIPDNLKMLNQRIKREFNPQKLDFIQIKSEACSRDLANNLINQESVHKIDNHEELMNRLNEKKSRLCYVLNHPSCIDDPVAFVYLALIDEIPQTIHSIIQAGSTSAKATNPELSVKKIASYYSITSPKKGLAGIDLGSFLIKRVLQELRKTKPFIEFYCTISPIPGFKNWLDSRLACRQQDLLNEKEIDSIRNLQGNLSKYSNQNILDVFQQFLEKEELFSDSLISKTIGPILLRLCYSYLVNEKRRKMAFDKVANFHLRNGASVYNQLRWKADLSLNGYTNSYGIMVNYIYFIDDIEINSNRYVKKGFVKTTSIEELEKTLAKL